MQTIRLNVNGMSCGGCEKRIALVLGRLGGICAIEADHRSGIVKVVFDSARVSDEAIRTSIERAGYEIAA